MIKFSHNEWAQRQFENAIKIKGIECVLQEFANYVCEEDKRTFIGYFCDDYNCFIEDDDEDEDYVIR